MLRIIGLFKDLECIADKSTKKEIWEEIISLENEMRNRLKQSNAEYVERLPAIELLDTNESSSIINGILSIVLNDDDWEWSQNLCIKYSKHKSHCYPLFGHIARIHSKLDLHIVIPII